MVLTMCTKHNWHWRCKTRHAQCGIDVAHCDCKARICKRGQGRHLYELEMVSAEYWAPSDFRKTCFLHQHILFIIINVKIIKNKKKSDQRELLTHKTSRKTEEDTIDSFKSDISMIIWYDRLRNIFVWCTQHTF